MYHPFGGAVDIIVVKQEDGTYKSAPWYVRFGKFQGVLKQREKVVTITVNDVDADFHMFLDSSGEAYFVKEEEEEVAGALEYGKGPQKLIEGGKLTETKFLEYKSEDAEIIGIVQSNHAVGTEEPSSALAKPDLRSFPKSASPRNFQTSNDSEAVGDYGRSASFNPSRLQVLEEKEKESNLEPVRGSIVDSIDTASFLTQALESPERQRQDIISNLSPVHSSLSPMTSVPNEMDSTTTLRFPVTVGAKDSVLASQLAAAIDSTAMLLAESSVAALAAETVKNMQKELLISPPSVTTGGLARDSSVTPFQRHSETMASNRTQSRDSMSASLSPEPFVSSNAFVDSSPRRASPSTCIPRSLSTPQHQDEHEKDHTRRSYLSDSDLKGLLPSRGPGSSASDGPLAGPDVEPGALSNPKLKAAVEREMAWREVIEKASVAVKDAPSSSRQAFEDALRRDKEKEQKERRGLAWFGWRPKPPKAAQIVEEKATLTEPSLTQTEGEADPGEERTRHMSGGVSDSSLVEVLVPESDEKINGGGLYDSSRAGGEVLDGEKVAYPFDLSAEKAELVVDMFETQWSLPRVESCSSIHVQGKEENENDGEEVDQTKVKVQEGVVREDEGATVEQEWLRKDAEGHGIPMSEEKQPSFEESVSREDKPLESSSDGLETADVKVANGVNELGQVRFVAENDGWLGDDKEESKFAALREKQCEDGSLRGDELSQYGVGEFGVMDMPRESETGVFVVCEKRVEGDRLSETKAVNGTGTESGEETEVDIRAEEEVVDRENLTVEGPLPLSGEDLEGGKVEKGIGSSLAGENQTTAEEAVLSEEKLSGRENDVEEESDSLKENREKQEQGKVRLDELLHVDTEAKEDAALSLLGEKHAGSLGEGLNMDASFEASADNRLYREATDKNITYISGEKHDAVVEKQGLNEENLVESGVHSVGQVPDEVHPLPSESLTPTGAGGGQEADGLNGTARGESRVVNGTAFSIGISNKDKHEAVAVTEQDDVVHMSIGGHVAVTHVTESLEVCDSLETTQVASLESAVIALGERDRLSDKSLVGIHGMSHGGEEGLSASDSQVNVGEAVKDLGTFEPSALDTGNSTKGLPAADDAAESGALSLQSVSRSGEPKHASAESERSPPAPDASPAKPVLDSAIRVVKQDQESGVGEQSKDLSEDSNVAGEASERIISDVVCEVPPVSPEFISSPPPPRPPSTALELSLCRHLLSDRMGTAAAAIAFESKKIPMENFVKKPSSILNNDKLVVRVGGRYYSWATAAPRLLGMLAYGQVLPPIGPDLDGAIRVDKPESPPYPKSQGDKGQAAVNSHDIVVTGGGNRGGWAIWPFVGNRREENGESGGSSKPHAPSIPPEAILAATGIALDNPLAKELLMGVTEFYGRPRRNRVRMLCPSPEQLATLPLQEGKNRIAFSFTTRLQGKQQVECALYVWRYNTRIVVSDVDGTITKSDVLGQVMPLLGKDWSQTGVARLYSAIRQNGYDLMFLSARAITQAHLTRNFLFTLKQDGDGLPEGPVVISPDGLFPSLYREVILRVPHEFKIARLSDIRALFPSDRNPFYAGFGNRETDAMSYKAVGIPKGRIFMINPKGEVVVNSMTDVQSYVNLHSLVHDIFPAITTAADEQPEREDFNNYNFWRMPLPDVDVDDLEPLGSKKTSARRKHHSSFTSAGRTS